MLDYHNLLGFVIALVAVVLLVGYLSRLAERVGLLDHPDPRKHHGQAVPLVGGLLLFIGICVSLAIVPQPIRPFISLIAGMAVLLVTGLLDDTRELSPTGKLVLQTIAAVLMVSWGELQVTHFGGIFGFRTFDLQEWAIPFTVLGTLFLINGLNMLDGVDGLAGMLGLVTLGWLLVVALLAGIDSPFLTVMLAVMGALVGFLLFNLRSPWRREARIFLGDSGSMMLGFAIAWFAVYIHQHAEVRVYPAAIAWIVAFPVVDLLCIYLRRIAAGKSPYLPDREHVHHRMLRAGWSVTHIVLILALVAAGFGAVGVAGWRAGVSEIVLIAGLVVALPVYIFVTRYLFSPAGAPESGGADD